MALDPNVMGWDDVIENDGQEFVILPEGDYTFTVTNFERGRFPGSAKLPPCNKATLTLTLDNDRGIATARTDLILYRTLEWKICSFFSSIGFRKHGEKLAMDWNRIVGACGKAHIRPRTYTDKSGVERQVNDVVSFIEAKPADTPAAPAGFTAVQEELPWGTGGF